MITITVDWENNIVCWTPSGELVSYPRQLLPTFEDEIIWLMKYPGGGRGNTIDLKGSGGHSFLVETETALYLVWVYLVENKVLHITVCNTMQKLGGV